MGAGASIKEVYGEAVQWFKQVSSLCNIKINPQLTIHSISTQYFDSEMYVEDFQSIDKDHDGG